MPRAQAVGAERSERLSATTAEGSTSSPQASRQSRARRWPSRRHSPRRVQRAKLLCSVVKGIPESQPSDAPLHTPEGQHPDQPDQRAAAA